MHCGNAAAALDRVRQERFDLVITDLIMPGLGRIALVSSLHRDPEHPHHPVLVVTGHDLSRDDQARLRGKVIGVVTKDGKLTGALRHRGSPRRRARERPVSPVDRETLERGPAALRLLLVDDHEPSRMLIRAILARSADPDVAGGALVEAGNLSQARSELKGQPLTSFCSMCNCPTAAGSPSLRDLPAQPGAEPGRDRADRRGAAGAAGRRLDAGCDAFLDKPFRADDLLALLARLRPAVHRRPARRDRRRPALAGRARAQPPTIPLSRPADAARPAAIPLSRRAPAGRWPIRSRLVRKRPRPPRVLHGHRPLLTLAPRREEDATVVLVQPVRVAPLVVVLEEVAVVVELVGEDDRALGTEGAHKAGQVVALQDVFAALDLSVTQVVEVARTRRR